jgi:nicotinate phosphoribosyltransferase
MQRPVRDMPIIRSLMEADFYKFTMGQLIHRLWPDVMVTFALTCRTKGVKLGRVLDIGQLREELDHCRTLSFSNSELHYLRGTNEHGDRMFDEPYLAEHLRGLRLNDYDLEVLSDGDLRLEFSGPWKTDSYWETLALSIINELYNRALLKNLSRFERDVLYAQGRLRLMEKIRRLRQHPGITFSDFGTRRRFSGDWQYYIDEVLAAELPGQYLGTSNTHAAMETGVVPMGTSAHELPMILTGIINQTASSVRLAQRDVVNQWWQRYGHGLSIFLPDTYGSSYFLGMLDETDLKRWKGFRQDSGVPEEFGEMVISAYEQVGIDPKKKLVVWSDGLDIDRIIELHKKFDGRIKTSNGWGTSLTNDLWDKTRCNDLWYGPLSLVIKPVRANGKGLVKLSDNLEKAIGQPTDVARMKELCGYMNTYRETCTY